MRYTMNAGILYGEPPSGPLAKIKSSVLGPVKRICLDGDDPMLKTDISHMENSDKQPGDVRERRYLLLDREDKTIARARPNYAQGEDPQTAGWPICRLPRVDRAQVDMLGMTYTLLMHNSQNYSLRDEGGREVLRIMHRGIRGGWSFEDEQGLDWGILCGLFVFCRYLEQENEFLVV